MNLKVFAITGLLITSTASAQDRTLELNCSEFTAVVAAGGTDATMPATGAYTVRTASRPVRVFLNWTRSVLTVQGPAGIVWQFSPFTAHDSLNRVIVHSVITRGPSSGSSFTGILTPVRPNVWRGQFTVLPLGRTASGAQIATYAIRCD